ncbi:MAG TPA: FAD-dependent oxidoreductase [Opitutaceae bacterium]
MKTTTHEFDLVVCGGGLAGFCAAVSAARLGAKTCLVHDRPVLGGNSSSEIRVTPHGAAAFHAYARETGVVSEVLIEERARNHEEIFENGWTNSVWDLALYDVATTTPNLAVQLNSAVVAVILDDGTRVTETPLPDARFGYLFRAACAKRRQLGAVVARVANAETERVLRARYFIDCTGDGIVADLAGCEWRMGSEGREEFGEPHAPEKPSRDTMGNSIHFRARDLGRPVPFTPPDWAVKHEDARYFYDQGRKPKDLRGGYWWLEIGVPWDTIHDAEDIRHELTRHTLGVWDWIKNKDPLTRDAAANYALDWIGQVPGKRESRRIRGRALMTEHDVQNNAVFPDEIAFGGWFLDLHTPGGLLAPTSEPASAEGYKPSSDYARKSYVGPYGVPLGALIAHDLDNLLMAGRNIGVTRAALGTVRVMATTALLGQAAGTACAHALRTGRMPYSFSKDDVRAVQQRLLRDGCFLPNVSHADTADLARAAQPSASSEDLLRGVAPEEKAHHEGLSFWRDQAVSTGRDELHARRGQWIAAAGGRVERIEVCVSNFSSEPQPVPVWLMPVAHIWDYRVDTGAPLAQATLVIPPGERQWIAWTLNVTTTPGRYVRLDLGANPAVAWHVCERIVPGHVAAVEMGGGRMRRYSNGVSLAFRVSPAQPCFAAANVLTGVTRPHRWTNLWRSDPAQPLPQWLQLEWPQSQRIAQVELTFPGHLVREYHAYGPFYRDPQCPRDYTIQAWDGQAWREALTVTGNYQRHRRHPLPQSVSTTKVRIVVTATNGDPAAAIYEVRCYAE